MLTMKNLPLSLALAAISGALTLKSPAEWSPRVRRAYVLAPGAAIGVIVAAALRRGAQQGRELAAAGRVDLVTPATANSDGGADCPAPLPSYVRTNAGSQRTTTIALTALAGAVGVASSGILALTLVVDERMETWLLRRGAARPRLVMAVITAVTSLVLDLIMDSKDAEHASP